MKVAIDFGAQFSRPVFIKDADAKQKVDQRLNQIALGRELLVGEIGCALAHWQVWNSSQSEWILVMEDDASFESDFVSLIEPALERVGNSHPAIVHLFDRGFRKPAPRLKRVWHQPAGTVCYAINSKARALASGSPVGTADWPVQLAATRFFTLWGLGIKEVGGASLISQNASRSSASPGMHYLGVLTRLPAIFRRFGALGVYATLLSPLLRDLRGALTRNFLLAPTKPE